MTSYRNVLKLLAISHTIAGILLCLVFFLPSLHAPMVALIYLGQANTSVFSEQLPFWVCVFGPTLASWGVLSLALFEQYFRAPSTRLWWQFLLALMVWAPLDTLLCITNNLYIGAVLNTLVLIAFLILWLKVKKLSAKQL